MNYEIGNPQLIWLMLSIPFVFALLIYSSWANRRALASFGSVSKRTNLIGESLSGLLLMLGTALLVLACMDIRWGKTNREVPQKGLEVVFALDVSRSMLARDAKPNRLARAKQQISDMVDEMVGDRIGLVVFAGEAVQAVPLTNHYNDFRQKLETLGPDTVSRGGSRLGDAIAEAADAFISKTNDHRTIILFTDGEDQESEPVKLAKELHAKNGTRVFTVGLGDIDQGARIPDGATRRSEFVEHEGQQVWSKLNGKILREIATETNAAYIPAGTKRVNMADVYHSYIASVEKSEFETAKINAFVPRFQWFAFPAFACLFLNVWLTSRRGESRKDLLRAGGAKFEESTSSRSRFGTSAKVASRAAAVAIVLLPTVSSAQTSNDSAASSINAANQLVRESKFQEAIDSLNQVDDSQDAKHRDELNYSLATAHFRNADLAAATTLFEQSAKSTNTRIASDSRYNLGNCHYTKALPLMEQQPDAAIQELEAAVTHYRSALRLDRQRSDARENIERAGKLIKQLKNQLDQNDSQQQENPQDQSSNEDQGQDEDQQNDSDSQSEEQQNDSASDDPQQESNPSQDEQSQSEQPQQQQDSDDSQGDQSQQSESDSANEQQSSTGEPNEESGENDSDQQGKGDETQNANSDASQPDQTAASDSQQQSQSAKDSKQEQDGDTQRQQADQPAEGEQPPEGDLSVADQSEGKPDDTSSANKMGARVGNEESGLMTKQEALKLLQAVRDRDMIRRLKQQQQRRQRRVRVDKDW